jgi:hypothetical protein
LIGSVRIRIIFPDSAPIVVQYNQYNDLIKRSERTSFRFNLLRRGIVMRVGKNLVVHK